MADQHIASHLPDVLHEAQVHLWVLQPSQLQVAVHVRAVRKTIAQVAVVMVTIRRHRHASVRSDAY